MIIETPDVDACEILFHRHILSLSNVVLVFDVGRRILQRMYDFVDLIELLYKLCPCRMRKDDLLIRRPLFVYRDKIVIDRQETIFPV